MPLELFGFLEWWITEFRRFAELYTIIVVGCVSSPRASPALGNFLWNGNVSSVGSGESMRY
jgi:hypothetical protein